ncbi:MAG TPA: UvrD-helicase domain-containing protein [Patescibacteria group bacterium]|nr:UvrD-helicase domain-containing protein [Patescibacteria group bacterium]
MSDNLLKNLNPEQQKAVLATDGPMIILAGAGSGKTRVLTHKVCYLISEKHIDPDNILMVTFTNKAATEMKERMAHMLSTPTKPLITTFHALCARILRIEGHILGLSHTFAIYDSSDQQDALKEAMKQLGLSPKEYKVGAIHAMISQAKNELISAEEYMGFAKGPFQIAAANVYKIYEKTLRENNAVDFDDLILLTVKLFDTTPQVLQKYQNKFHYICIDEYQDTNKAQYKLTRLLGGKWQNICVVGDFSQSIYSWRGADFKNLSKFQKDFPSVKTFTLSQNYRSTQKILDAASQVIANNTSHPVLSLWTENPNGENITLFEARNEEQEASFIANYIQDYDHHKLSDIAVLYRTNAQSRVIEEVLLHFGIPYTLVGGTRFYERKEIKDVLSYLRLLSNPKDSISFKRAEKLGKGRLAKFVEIQGELDPEKFPPTIEILDTILSRTGYLDLYDQHDEDDSQRLENIKELRSVAIAFPNLTEFLENVSLVEQEEVSTKLLENDKKNTVTLMTLHAAKGLEFPVVFMIGMEEGLFPHSRALMDKDELEEERRLMYVGMTRAREKLFLTYARRRLFFGQRSSNTISRFLLELPQSVISQNIPSEYNQEEYPDYL